MYVKVTPIRKVFIPNTFTPNADGHNDYFNIYASIPNVQGIEELTILNRWGAVIYQRKDFLPNEINASWDGTYQGKNLESGVYVYLTKIRFLDGKVVRYVGDITLVR